MLHDSLTGLPTLPVAIERSRQLFKERGELVVLYFNFVRYSKIEEIYGWEKLDSVLETTASAVREFLDDDELGASRVMVSFTNDDDFIFFHVPASGVAAATESEITEMVTRLQRHVGGQIEEAHGEDIAALFDIYVGRAHLYYNPKIRLERLIYRGIREAANASRSVEQRERARRVGDLRASLRDRSVYIDYHPIVVAATREIFGYEALARGQMRTLRSPEVMFDVAAEADLIWELSRLCRARALEGMDTRLSPGQLSSSTSIRTTSPIRRSTRRKSNDPSRVVIEITERTAIKDYPKFRERLKAFRNLGYRFAVDDAGSGYAGLGSIANLEPDFIKLDISLINAIDTNFIKQNLVQTMVPFRRRPQRDGDRRGGRARRGVQDGAGTRRAPRAGVLPASPTAASSPIVSVASREASARDRARPLAHQRRDELERSFGRTESGAHDLARRIAGRASCRRIVEPVPQRDLERRRVRCARRGAGSEQEAGFTAVRVARPEQHGHAESRGLEHRVQTRSVESAADERNVGERIEIARARRPGRRERRRRRAARRQPSRAS